MGMVRLAGGEDGRIGNFDFEAADQHRESSWRNSSCRKTSRRPALRRLTRAVAASTKADNNHTLKGQDLNNFAPRFGFAFSPFDSNRLVVRGGYGIFFDRPSAAFINTIFSNYPFLREVEVTAPTQQRAGHHGLVTAGPDPAVQPLPAEPHRLPVGRGSRHLRDSRRHAGDEAGGRHEQPDRSGHGPAGVWATSPRPSSSARLTATCGRLTSSSGTWASSTSCQRTCWSRRATSARRARSSCRRRPSIRAST